VRNGGEQRQSKELTKGSNNPGGLTCKSPRLFYYCRRGQEPPSYHRRTYRKTTSNRKSTTTKEMEREIGERLRFRRILVVRRSSLAERLRSEKAHSRLACPFNETRGGGETAGTGGTIEERGKIALLLGAVHIEGGRQVI